MDASNRSVVRTAHQRRISENPRTKPRASPQTIQVWIIAMFRSSISFVVIPSPYLSVLLINILIGVRPIQTDDSLSDRECKKYNVSVS